jgi:hypothetical protein
MSHDLGKNGKRREGKVPKVGNLRSTETRDMKATRARARARVIRQRHLQVSFDPSFPAQHVVSE